MTSRDIGRLPVRMSRARQNTIARRFHSKVSQQTISGSFRTRVAALQAGHLVKRSRTCGLSTNEYRGGNAPMRSWFVVRRSVPTCSGLNAGGRGSQ